jgi:hypothetical protein
MTTTTSLHDSCCCSPPIEYSGSPSPLETPMADHAASDTAMPTQPEHSGRLAEVGGNPLTPRSEQDKPETAPKLTPDPTFGNPLPMGMSTAGGRTGAWLDGSMATTSSCPPTRWNYHAAHVLRLLPMHPDRGSRAYAHAEHLASWRWGSASRHVSTDRQVDRQTLRQSGSMADDLGRLYTS